jgi:membrane-bound lytic murein transglycosylase A
MAASLPTPPQQAPELSPVSWSALPGWAEDDHGAAFAAFVRSARRASVKPYRSGSLGMTAAMLEPAFALALQKPDRTGRAARRFFEVTFMPRRITPADNRASGLLTGFYEPVIAASRQRHERFAVPFLAPPDDLVEITDANRPSGWGAEPRFGRQTASGVVEYHDRRAIETGILGDSAKVIAWVESRVDAFFAHVQGAARLDCGHGDVMRVTYAAKSGHAFSAIGKRLADLGEIPLAKVTMQSIREWLARHPDRIDELLWHNRSYIFFRQALVEDPELGPVAAAKVPLTPGRSLAVDRLLHSFGSPLFISAPHTADGPLQRLMIAQDTGSAILGAARGDFFAGSGDAAGEIAGRLKADCDFFLLVPKLGLEQGDV